LQSGLSTKNTHYHLSLLLAFSLGEPEAWLGATWDSAKQIVPLLAGGVLASGFLLGTPTGGAGIIPNEWIAALVGGNSLGANLFASVVGALMYFATLAEVPIVQGLLNSGMGQGPALSLPSMLVIHSVIGTAKALVYVGLVVVMATLCGWLFGVFV
jgi:uncharacterized membrane protein YraQ (UPF0718 family)